MKIAYFTNTYLPNRYGSVNSIESFRKELERLGHQVFIFVPNHQEYQDENPAVFRTFSLTFPIKRDYPIAVPFWKKVWNRMDELKPDLVHCHQPFLLGDAGLKWAKKNGKKTVFTYHCQYEKYTHYAAFLPEKIAKWYVIRKATNFANQCDLVISPSNSIKEIIINQGVTTKIITLPTGIFWKKFQNGRRAFIRNKYGIKDDELVLLCLGRIEKEKNLLFLAEAVKRVMINNKKVKFVMVGEGSLWGQLEKIFDHPKLAGRIIATGLIPPEEVQDYYSAGDIFLQTSLSETQGIIYFEAMASGLMVIALDAPGARDIILNNQDGILVENNLEKYIEAINCALTDREKIKRLGAKAREKMKAFDQKHQGKRLEKIYQELFIQR